MFFNYIYPTWRKKTANDHIITDLILKHSLSPDKVHIMEITSFECLIMSIH